jgi:hypothetical protein
MTTLGQRLAEQAALRDQTYNAAAQTAIGENKQKFFTQLGEVSAWLSEQIVRVQEAVDNDIPLKLAVIPGGFTADWSHSSNVAFSKTGDTLPASWAGSKNKFHTAWVKFADELSAQNLKAVIKYNHDGGGHQSWYELHIMPDLIDKTALIGVTLNSESKELVAKAARVLRNGATIQRTKLSDRVAIRTNIEAMDDMAAKLEAAILR